MYFSVLYAVWAVLCRYNATTNRWLAAVNVTRQKKDESHQISKHQIWTKWCWSHLQMFLFTVKAETLQLWLLSIKKLQEQAYHLSSCMSTFNYCSWHHVSGCAVFFLPSPNISVPEIKTDRWRDRQVESEESKTPGGCERELPVWLGGTDRRRVLWMELSGGLWMT